MIEWLSIWLKQIILLVLIATFIDLLLPNSSMDRYVKLVMGLLIIMAILSPTFQLLNKDIDLASIALSQKKGYEEKMDSLNEIKEKGSGLKKEQETLVQEEVEKSVEMSVKKDLDNQFPIEVINAKVEALSMKNKSLKIKRLQVVARAKRISKDEPNQENVNGMKPIEPVIISANEYHKEKSKSTLNKENIELTRQITQYLQRTWHLLPEQINVRMDSS